MTKKNDHATSFWLDTETRQVLTELVEETGMSRSAVVREALRRMHADPQMAEIRRLISQLERTVTGR